MEYQPVIPTYFGPSAFAGLRLRGSAIEYDPGQLNEISNLSQKLLDRPLPHLLSQTAFMYRYSVNGADQPVADPSFYKVAPAGTFITHRSMALPIGEAPEWTTKAEIEHSNKNVFQIQVKDFDEPLAYALASSLAWPPVEERRVRTQKGAWLTEMRNICSFLLPGIGVTERKKQRLLREVAANYAGAITLRPRTSPAC